MAIKRQSFLLTSLFSIVFYCNIHSQKLATSNNCELSVQLKKQNLINIKDVSPEIVVDLKYSTVNNFSGEDLYGCLTEAYFQKEVAEKLAKAQQILQKKFPYYSLLIFDAARPLSVQEKLWNKLSDVPFQERIKFLSNPKQGSLHNYGVAVDISIIDEDGIELDMGTPYDYLGELAYPTSEAKLLNEGKLSNFQISNRKILREVMQQAGFYNIQTEWWHFNAFNETTTKSKYSIIQ